MAPDHVLAPQLPVFGSVGETTALGRQLGNRKPVGATDHHDNEALRADDPHTDIDGGMLHDRVLVETRIELRMRAKGKRGGANHRIPDREAPVLFAKRQ